MNELEEIYKRIEYLRNNGVKMKEIAREVEEQEWWANESQSCKTH